MGDNQKALDLLQKFPEDQIAVEFAEGALKSLYPDAIGISDELPIYNQYSYRLPSGELIAIDSDTFRDGFLEILSRDPNTKDFGIGPETYAYVSKLNDSFSNQTPKPEFSEATSTTPDKIRLEELEQFKNEDPSTLAKNMNKEERRIKDWEEKQKETKETKTITKKEIETEPNVFVVQIQPKIITLTEPAQEQLQAVKNAFEKGGEANFRKEVEEKVKKEIETRLTPGEEADFLVASTVDIVTKTVKKLPLIITKEVELETSTLAPIKALTASQKTAQLEGVKKVIDIAVLAENQVTEVLSQTASFVTPALGQLYQPIKEEDTNNFEITEAKPSFKDGFIARVEKLVELEKEINRLGPDLTDAEKQSLISEFYAMAEREDGYLQFISHAVSGKRTEGDWGEARSTGQGITAYAKNKSLNYLQDKFTIKFGGEAGEKGIQVMIGKKSVATIKNELTSKISTKVASVTAKTTASKVAAGTALKTLGAKLAGTTVGKAVVGAITAIGLAGGPPTWLVSLVAWLGTDILVWIRKHWKGFLQGLAGVGALAALSFHSLPLGLASGGVAAVAFGPRAIGGAIYTGLGLFLSVVGGTLVTIGTTVLGIIIATPILVALILFIINNGAYMVPPSSETGDGGTAISCFVLVDEATWPQDKKDNLTNAIDKLVADHPPFVNKICNKGEVLLHYDSFDPGYWGHYDGTNNITLYPGGLTNQLDAEYILSHESSHLMAAYSASYTYVEYLDYPDINTEPVISTYFSCAGTSIASEKFAEAIALYASEKPFICLPGGLQSNYPIHWQFCDETIFK